MSDDEREALADLIESALRDEAMVETRGWSSDDPEEWVSEPLGLLVGVLTKAILAAGFHRQPQITEAMVKAAVRAHKVPRLHVNDSQIDREIDMRAALEAAEEARS